MGSDVDTQKIFNSIQVLTGIAVIAGLALVVWELQQNREATTSQLTSDGMTFVSTLNTVVMGEQTADVLAKACDSPDELTRSEYYVLDNYYAEVLNRYRRIALLKVRGSFYEEASFDAGMGIGFLLETAPGRAYLKTYGVSDRLIGQELLSKLEAWDGTTCQEYYGRWEEAVRGELAKEGG